MTGRIARAGRLTRVVASAAAVSLLISFMSMADANAQQAGWSRTMSQGIESGPLPVPDPGAMSSGTPLYMQTLGNNTPDPGDIAPDNGQSFTLFNRRF